jgi:hypothetical protein
MLAAKTSRHDSKLIKHARPQAVDFGLQPGVWAKAIEPVLRLHHTIPYHSSSARTILPGIHNYAAVHYSRADCRISGLKHIFCYPKLYMYDLLHLFLSSFAHVNSVPDLNFLHLLLLLNSSHIHLASPQ